MEGVKGQSCGHHLSVWQRARNKLRWSIELPAEDRRRHFGRVLDTRNMFETYNGYLELSPVPFNRISLELGIAYMIFGRLGTR